jgi:hypothetical protein
MLEECYYARRVQRPCWQCPDPMQTRPLREARPTPRINVERGSLRSKGRVSVAADPMQTRPLREARPTPRINHNVERGSLRSKGRVSVAADLTQTRPLREARPTPRINHGVERVFCEVIMLEECYYARRVQRPWCLCRRSDVNTPSSRGTSYTRINVERGSLRSKGRVSVAPIRRKRALFERHVLHQGSI